MEVGMVVNEGGWRAVLLRSRSLGRRTGDVQEDLLVQIDHLRLGEFCPGGIVPDLENWAKRIVLVGGDHLPDLFGAQADPAPHGVA